VDDTLSATYQITQLPTGEDRRAQSEKQRLGCLRQRNRKRDCQIVAATEEKDGTVERELELVFKLKEMH
jgi:colicin import membrane protein